MPKLSLPNQGIVIPIEGTYVIGNTAYERRLHVDEMRESFRDKQVSVEMTMRFYLNGQQVTGSKLIQPVRTAISATNRELCDAVTGEVLCLTHQEFIQVPVEQEVTQEVPTFDPVTGEQTGTELQTSMQTVLVDQLNPALLNEDGSEKTYAPQYDWFFDLGENHEINVHNLIRAFSLQAVAIGAFE